MNNRSFFMGVLVLPLAVLGLGIALASDVTIPNTFVANTPALAAEVNANFAAVEAAIDDNDARLDTLEAATGPTSQGQVRGYVFFTGAAGTVGNSFMTTGGTPTVTRNAAGSYTITWPGESFFFNEDPTAIQVLGSPRLMASGDSSGGNQAVGTENAAGVLTDPNTLCVTIFND